jgi:hypothetical protein
MSNFVPTKHKPMPAICYLCGQPIEPENRDDDHVPPKQFFPSEIRQRINLDRLITLPTHRKCNSSYQQDEDYFVNTIAAVSYENPILRALWRDIARSAQRVESFRFNIMILKQLQYEAVSPGGILMSGRSQIIYQKERIDRVVWKIVRGLFYYKNHRLLPEETIHFIQYMHGRNTGLDNPHVRNILEVVLSQDAHGEYGRIFAYKFLVNEQEENVTAWALLFWDRHIFLIGHHDPECKCRLCKEKK